MSYTRSAIDRAVEELRAEGKITYILAVAPYRYIINGGLLTIDLEKRLLVHENSGVIVLDPYTPMAEVRAHIMRYVREKAAELEKAEAERRAREQTKLL